MTERLIVLLAVLAMAGIVAAVAWTELFDTVFVQMKALP